jgi:formamidopyrimidine-DNA glycosylase
MPEVPEIETIKKYLEKDLIGRTIKDVKILSKKSFIGYKKKILNSKILKIERKGKMLIFKLATDKYGFGTDNNGLYMKKSTEISYPYKSVLKSASIRWLVFHLKLTWQLIFYPTNGNEFINKW